MKLPLVCMKCFAQDNFPPEVFGVTGLRDDNLYELKCPRGHTSYVILQEQRFEVLFQLGAYAISDGYFREGVVNFSTSLERFNEFFLRALLLERGVPANIIDDSWKEVSAQSERQLGAYILLHTLEFKQPPTLLKNNSIKFRNAVVHRGRIPTEREAVEYGQEVLELLRAGVHEVKHNFGKAVTELTFRHIAEAQRKVPRGENAATQGSGTIVSLTIDGATHNEQTLDQAIKKLPRKWFMPKGP